MERLRHESSERLRLAWSRLRALPSELWAVVPAALLLYVLMQLPFTPGTAEVRKAKAEQASVMLSADGAVLAEFKRVNRAWRSLDQISPHVVQALIATEDHRFLEHHGIDLRRTAAAAWSTLRGDLQGGSTLTQQLARNLYPQQIGRAPTLTRKVREALTALKIEANYSKPEILETYLNTVPFLYNATGIEMAARTYFGKSASRLDVTESATLVGMLKGTSHYNPVQNPKRSRERRNLVLAQMARHGFVEASALRGLQRQPLGVDFQPQREQPGPAPHLAQHVKGWLEDWASRHGHDLYADGLKVRTTLHAPLQALANEALSGHVASLRSHAARRARGEPLQAGFLALDPRSGEVRAWVGSTDFATDQFDHVQQARRQPGSTFKPFVYGAAFAQGMQPTDVLLDEPVTIGRGRHRWTPGDATPPTHQPMTLADGLAFSRNRITAQLVRKVKPARVARLARDMGIRDSELDAVPSLALGTSPVTLKEMVAAYGTIANRGRYIAPVIVTQVEDGEGRVLETFRPPRPAQALGEPQALMLVDALRGVIDRGTGRAIRDRFGITADVAGKTGTTQDNTDGWFILMHPHLVGGAWVGFNDARHTMGDGWGPGARSALPIVGTVFQQALQRGWLDPRAGFGHPLAPQQQAGGWWTRLMGAAPQHPQQPHEDQEPPPKWVPPPAAVPPPPVVVAIPAPPPAPVAQPLPEPAPHRIAPRVRLLSEDDDDDEWEDRRERRQAKDREHWGKWQEKQAKKWDRELKKWEKRQRKAHKRKGRGKGKD